MSPIAVMCGYLTAQLLAAALCRVLLRPIPAPEGLPQTFSRWSDPQWMAAIVIFFLCSFAGGAFTALLSARKKSANVVAMTVFGGLVQLELGRLLWGTFIRPDWASASLVAAYLSGALSGGLIQILLAKKPTAPV